MGIHEQKTNPSALTGVAFHKYAELVLKGQESEVAKEAAELIIKTTTDVEWGKTGSVETCLSELTKLCEAWHSDYCLPGPLLFAEYKTQAKVRGIKLPIKGFVDAVVDIGDNLCVLVDWKTVKSYDEAVTPAYLVQAFYYKWIVEGTLGRKVVRMDFVQIKASKNTDGSPRVRELSYDFTHGGDEEKGMKKLTNQIIREMLRKRKNFVPNLRDSYDGEASWKQYLQDNILC